MLWIVSTPSGVTRQVVLSETEVAILAEQAVICDSTLASMMPDDYWERGDVWPGQWVESWVSL